MIKKPINNLNKLNQNLLYNYYNINFTIIFHVIIILIMHKYEQILLNGFENSKITN